MSAAPTESANPAFSLDDVRALVQRHWGVDGALRPLVSMEDQNVALRSDDGLRAVVKIAGRHTPTGAIELQNAAMLHLHRAGAGFVTPRPLPTVDGELTVDSDGHRIRLLTWVEGVPLSERAYLGPDDLTDLGVLAARVSVALDGFDHPSLQVANEWDVRNALDVLARAGQELPAHWRPHLDDALAAFVGLGEVGDLPLAVVHGDVTPVNAVCAGGADLGSRPTGVLDFGDITRSWRIGDAAAAAVGALEHHGTGDPLTSVLAVLAGYHAVAPFSEREIDAFWPLVCVRAAVTAAVSGRQYVRNVDNRYAAASADSGLRAIARVASVPAALARAAVRHRCGLVPVPGAAVALAWLRAQPTAEVVPGASGAVCADLSVEADHAGEEEWSDAGRLRRTLSASSVTVGRWGEVRLVGHTSPGPRPPAALSLGVDLFAAEGTPVSAPVDGVARLVDGGVVLRLAARSAPLHVRLGGVVTGGVEDGDEVRAGQKVGTVAASGGVLPPHVHVQVLLDAELPTSGTAEHRLSWLALSPDPSALVGLDVAAPEPVLAGRLRHDRDAVVATPQHLYYAQPPAFVRGWRHHLYDTDGRCYLDMINNIAAVGHSHPRVTEAAVRQLRRLNTNSRFLYDAMARYAARIAALLPPQLDRVFLVNSGSEAADLALQLAQRHTGRRDVVALAGAYHGWTGSVIAVSSSPMDRPQWREELESWVHVAEQPDTYRGAHGADPEPYRASVRASLAAAAAAGGAAAFVCEPLLGNQGGLELPPGYLTGVYDDVRAAGGLCVADEVQVGMARTGASFWAFEHEGVVPDIVYTAKATGNGHPLGVVACRSDIADHFDGQTAYFSSTGGGPVSCEIGIAVLDVIRDEGLQRNAAAVGAHLRAGFTELADRHPLIGAVHGRGLYQGVDLVTDRATRAPAVYEALAVSERLRLEGVVMQPTGDAFNVLKIKPPMCIDRGAADYFLGALDRVLTELY